LCREGIDDIMLTSNMKKKLEIPENKLLADFLPTITITAKQLEIEITSFNNCL
jgi:DNA-damage-inducible protein D